MRVFSKIATPIFALSSLLFMGAGCIGPSTSGDTLQTSGTAGIYISSDKGEAWQPLVSYPTVSGVQSLAGVSVYRIIPDPHDSHTLYWLSRTHGMFLTNDDGKSWQQVKSPLSSGFVYDLTIHPEDPCTLFATNGTFVYKSEDCTRTWKEVYRESRADVSIRTLEFHQFAPFQMLAGMSNGDLLTSNDFGSSWTLAKRLGNSIVEIVSDPYQANRLYLATRSSGLYRSDDGGTEWVSLSAGLQTYTGALEYHGMTLHPSTAGTLYWISTYGILMSQDAVQIYSFGIGPKTDTELYYTATINSRSTFYRSIDGGKSWITRRLPTGQIPTALYIPPEHVDWVYLGFTIPAAE